MEKIKSVLKSSFHNLSEDYSVRFLAIFSKVKIDLGLNEGQSQMLGQPRYSCLLRPSILLRSLKAIKKKQIVGNTKGFFFYI